MWELVREGSLLEAIAEYLGGSSEEVPDRYDENSSIQQIDTDTCPIN